MPVLLTDITVRLGEDGKVFAFGSDARIDIDVDPTPRIDAAGARMAALGGLDFEPSRDRSTGGHDLFLLPLRDGVTTEYKLTRRVEVLQHHPPHRWVTYVDAHTAEVVWRFDRVRYAQIEGSVSSLVHVALPTVLETVTNPDTYVNIDGVDVTTNKLGDYFADNVSGVVDVQFELEGPWAKALRQDGQPDALVETTVDTNSTALLSHHWDNSNSHSNARDAYHGIVRAHDYIKTLDPAFTDIDIQMPVNVLITTGDCNAFWTGDSVNFYIGGDGCHSTAKVIDIVVHEYGHAINDLFYIQLGFSDGMLNRSMQEGMSDVTAAFLTDDAIIGNELYLDGSDVRTLNNTNTIPHDVSSSVHRNGLIIGGAFWDLREAVGLETAERLAHYARYGAPDDEDNMIAAYLEYLLEVLVADDDDSNLANGTPNGDAILGAFSLHGISPASSIRFSHTALPDTDRSDEDLVVQVNVSSDMPIIPIDPNSVRMSYRSNYGAIVTQDMQFVANQTWQATIPGQREGTVVSYWFEASAFGQVRYRPALFGSRPHQFYVGTPSALFEDDFETDQGWTVGAAGDDATSGVWERGAPEPIVDSDGDPVLSQSGFDHSSDGTLCFVTGASAGDDFDSFDVDGGKTTLLSPVFDLSGAVEPVILYHRLFTNNILRYPGSAPASDPWLVEITSDGVDWVEIENTTDSNVPANKTNSLTVSDWQRVAFPVDELVAPSSSVQLRFTVTDQAEASLVEAMLDDFLIFDFEQAIVPVAVSNFQARSVGASVTVSWQSVRSYAAADFRVHATADHESWVVFGVERDEFGSFVAVDRHHALGSANTVSYELAAREPELGWVSVARQELQLARPPISLHRPWPNPFNPATNVAFSVGEEAQVDLGVYDASGRRVATLARGSFSAGTHAMTWNGLDQHGRAAASGVYYVMFRANGREVGARKLVLMK